MTQTPQQQADSLATSLADVAGELYTVDNSPDVVFAQSQADAGNVAAAAIVQALAEAWEAYSHAKTQADLLVDAAHKDDADALQKTQGPAAQAVRDLAQRVERLRADATRLAESARTALTRFDQAEGAVRDLRARAAPVGADHDPEITVLTDALDKASTAIAADPTSTAAIDDLAKLVDAATARVNELEREKATLPGLLAAAHTKLAEIERLAAQGAAAFDHARTRIAHGHLLEPLDLDADGERALKPWLDRIQREADEGGWQTAFKGLAAWQQSAAAWLANAQQVADANTRPVEHRNEIRGLLDAYRAKAAAAGRAEDAALARLHAAAHDALFTAPCDIAAAERLVRDYVNSVNRGSTP